MVLRRAGVRPPLPRRLGLALLVLTAAALLVGGDLARAARVRHREVFAEAAGVLERLRLDVEREHAARWSEMRALAFGRIEPTAAWRTLAARYHCIDLRNAADSLLLRLGECPVQSDASPIIVLPTRGAAGEGGVVRAVLRRDALFSPFTSDARVGAGGYAVLYDRTRRRVLQARNAPDTGASDDPLPQLNAASAAAQRGGVRQLRYGWGKRRTSAAVLDLAEPSWTLLVAGRVGERGTLWQRAWTPNVLLFLVPAALLALAMLFLFRRRLAAAAAFARAEGRRARAAELVLSWLSTDANDPVLAARQLSHELRNPLASLRLELEALTGSRDPRARRVAGAGLQEMERLDAVLRNALTLASGEATLGQRAPLLAALHRAGETLRAELWGAQCRLELPPPGADVWVPVSPDALQRIFINLFRNARNAMPHGGTITVSFRTDQGSVHVQVADEGTGIPLDQRSRLFEPLVTNSPGGTGLGLPAVRSVVERAGGRVFFVDPPGAGAIVEVVLPVLKRAEDEA